MLRPSRRRETPVSKSSAAVSESDSEPFAAEESDTAQSTVSSPKGPEPECDGNQYVVPNDVSGYHSKVKMRTTAAC